ncbi:Uncharacterized protein FWK35_00013264, partial [Aphis craccivora]
HSIIKTNQLSLLISNRASCDERHLIYYPKSQTNEKAMYKRRFDFMKKAYEFSVLCDYEVAIIIFDMSDKLYDLY